MQEENTTPDSLSSETSINLEGSVDGAGTVGSVEAPEALSLQELNNHLGKNFPTKESALKALKDTFSFVGVKKEDINKEVQNVSGELAKQLKALQVDRFFDKNPDLAQFKPAYEKVGGDPEAFFNAPEFKPLIEKARGYDETQKVKTVLESSPRLASSRDNFSKAKEFITSGKKEDGEKAATRAVMEAFSEVFSK